MKKAFILTLIAAAALCLPMQGKQRTVTEVDSLGRTTRIIELLDTVRDGKAETDTLSITTYAEPQSETYTETYSTSRGFLDFDDIWPFNTAVFNFFIAVSIILLFGFPIIVIALIFYFRNKNRKQKYRLLEQALASGQPLPKGFFSEMSVPDNRTKGFKNIATGIGLFFFLWLLVDELSIASIGLLIMFIGFGQLAVYYTRPKKDRTREPEKPQNTAATDFPASNETEQ